MRFEIANTKLDYKAYGIFINDKVAIYDQYQRVIVSFIFHKWCLSITVLRDLSQIPMIVDETLKPGEMKLVSGDNVVTLKNIGDPDAR